MRAPAYDHVPGPPARVVLQRRLGQLLAAAALAGLTLVLMTDFDTPGVLLLVVVAVLTPFAGVGLGTSALVVTPTAVVARGTVLHSRKSLRQNDDAVQEYYVVEVLIEPPLGRPPYRDKRRVRFRDGGRPEPGNRCVVWIHPGQPYLWTCRVVAAERLDDAVAQARALLDADLTLEDRLTRLTEIVP